MLSRRAFNRAVPLAVAGSTFAAGCSDGSAGEGVAAASARLRLGGPEPGLRGVELGRELVRYATLAPSSHNTQCWTFALEPKAITIRPDFARRCPAVDPDDHHLYVSLGCAAQNLILAANAHGLAADAVYDPQTDAVRVVLADAAPQVSPLFHAIVSRQCTRGDYDARPLPVAELRQLEAAAADERVRLLLLTDRPSLDTVRDFVVEGNGAQISDRAFVDELKAWIRFNGTDALRTGDGLYSRSSGNPEVPAWLGRSMFRFFFTAKAENEKYVRQLRSSAGVAVFVAAREDKAHWVEVGRAYERFALQATALGIRNAHLNMPVEVAALRPRFAAALGLAGTRPDLVVRFGRGPTLPPSLRRPVQAVLA